MDEQTGAIIWRRRYDEARLQLRMRRFWMFYAAPVALLIAVVGIVAGIGQASGLLILLGISGAMLFVWIWLDGRNERANPTVTLEDGQLRWAKQSVPINEVTRFTTYMESTSMNVGRNSSSTGVTARAKIGAAKFMLVDGTEIKFAWVSLDDQQLAELRSALEQILPGRWQPPATLHQPM